MATVMQSDSETPEAAIASLLRWYVEMGVDAAIDEAPHDRFAEAVVVPPRPQAAPAPPPAIARPQDATATLSADALTLSARESAAAATTLEDLRARLMAFDGCSLKATATRLVFGDGEAGASVMFVGEAPGADEDRQGVPFVGRAGQLLDKMLGAVALDRKAVYIANVVPWRPPGNRTPTPLETALCLPFTRRQIELVNPKILVCLGAAAAQTLLGVKEGIMRLRGRPLEYRGDTQTLPAFAMLHPAYLLRQPAHKRMAWQDLRQMVKAIRALDAGLDVG